MKKILLGAVSLTALGAVAAQGADLPPPPAAYVAPPPTPAPAPAAWDWSGGYIGVNAGVAFLDDTLSVSGFGALVSKDETDTGFTAGGQIGWNFQNGHWVFGVEGDINYLDVSSELTFAGKAAGTFDADYDWFATIRARAGYAAGNNLLYITGGIAFLGADFSIADAGGFTPTSKDKTLTGWTIGGGVEHMFDPNWSAKLEYLYANFESYTITDGTTTVKANPDLHVVRIGLNYLF
jgi:opacity protein-like surface antigen